MTPRQCLLPFGPLRGHAAFLSLLKTIPQVHNGTKASRIHKWLCRGS